MSIITSQKHSGFTLIEVLVAALVLGIGVLGLATTMLLGLKSNQSAYFRSQASAAAYDMADRIRLNRAAAVAGSYNNIDIDKDSSVASALTCNDNSTGCTPTQQAAEDIRQWSANFVGSNASAARLPDGRGTVSRDGSQRFVITVTWSGVGFDSDNPSQRANTTESLTVTFSL